MQRKQPEMSLLHAPQANGGYTTSKREYLTPHMSQWPGIIPLSLITLGVTEHEFFDQMGVYFVGFVGQYGYDRVLSVLGRHMRDFLNGLDNLHEYLKFSYPRMRAPSFICENETRHGLTLHYRSKRRGFVYYTMGQIREVSPPYLPLD
uniref:Heme NO-binding domain-containing protein n=1 Tax=Timema poppense TaxID=170557 RepID=A0A7R9DDD6_TIMPO|nr:unnamed protein product [Timema poppensis]